MRTISLALPFIVGLLAPRSRTRTPTRTMNQLLIIILLSFNSLLWWQTTTTTTTTTTTIPVTSTRSSPVATVEAFSIDIQQFLLRPIITRTRSNTQRSPLIPAVLLGLRVQHLSLASEPAPVSVSHTKQ